MATDLATTDEPPVVAPAFPREELRNLENRLQSGQGLLSADTMAVRRAIAAYDAVVEERNNLFNAAANVGVRKIEVVDGKVVMELTLAQEMMRLFAGSALAMLDESGAQNCLEMRLAHPELRDQPVTLTLQRHPGKTPMELKAEAEAKLAATEQRVSAWLDFAFAVGGAVGCLASVAPEQNDHILGRVRYDASLRLRLENLEEFARDVRDNYDHEGCNDPSVCRVCKAEQLVGVAK